MAMAQAALQAEIEVPVEASPGPASGRGPAPVHRVVRNSLFNLAVQAVYALLYLAAIAALARGLGKEAFGTYYVLFALVLTVQLVCEAGLGTVLTRRLARSPERWRETAGEAAGLFAAAAAASVVVLATLGAAWSWARDGAMLVPCVLAGLTCGALQVHRFASGVLAAFELFAYENAARLLQGSTFAVLAVGLAWLDRSDVSTVMGALAASQVVAALVVVIGLCLRCGRVRWHFRPGIAPGWLAESVPLGCGDVLRGLLWQVDTVLLGLLVPAGIVGIYSVAYRPLGPINWVPLAVLTALFPTLARTAASNRAALARSFATSVRLLWMAALPIAVILCVCADPVVHVIAGPEYAEAARPLRVVIWITCLSFVSYPFRFVLAALGRPRAYATLVLASLVVQVGLGLTLIPHWSYWGACTGSVVSEALFTATGLALCGYLGVGGIDWSGLARAAVAAALMAGALWPARELAAPVLAPVVVAAAGLYLVLCIALGALRPDELRRVREACGIGPVRLCGAREQ
jgi:O-antigen/teichoic acid export membrane protein